MNRLELITHIIKNNGVCYCTNHCNKCNEDMFSFCFNDDIHNLPNFFKRRYDNACYLLTKDYTEEEMFEVLL